MPGGLTDTDDVVEGARRFMSASPEARAEFQKVQQEKNLSAVLAAIVGDWTDYREVDFALVDRSRSTLELRFGGDLEALGYKADSRTKLFDLLFEKVIGAPTKFGPLDLHSPEEWIRRFKRYGFIKAEIVQDEVAGTIKRHAVVLDPKPAVEGPYYRGSSRELASRWSWTDKIAVAATFAIDFHDQSEPPIVWVCEEVEDYLARFNFNDHSLETGKWTYWSEQILIPRKVRRMDAVEVADLLPEANRARWNAVH